MDTWPRIPRPAQNASSARAAASSLPPPGSVVMASVEEDLGDGMYALKWNGNRIAVTSQAVLRPGQSLILKSERSADGKVSLVVQGPALPNPGELIGRPVYGPAERQPAQDANQNRNPQSGEIAASVQPSAAPPGQPVASLLGLVLEPVDELAARIGFVIDEAAVEKAEWQRHFEQAENSNPDDETAAGQPDQSAKPAAPPPEQTNQNNQPKPDLPVENAPVAARPAEVPPNAETVVRPPVDVAPPPPETQAKPYPPPAPLPEPAPLPPPMTGAEPALPAPIAPPAASGPVVVVPETLVPPPQANAPESPAVVVPPPPAPPEPETKPVPPPSAQPEIALKETLIQLIKSAELPLIVNELQNLVPNTGQKVPEAIADKAAGILLRASGLTPDTETMAAARALVDANVQVDRPTVQAMLALAANAPEEERAVVFKAAARQAAKDIPLAAPLASGLADVLARRESASFLLDKAAAALSPESFKPEVRPLAATAVEMLELLSVDLEGEDAAFALERYIATFGRTALGKTTALVETAAQTVLENHPVLPKIDKALTALLAMLEPEMAEKETTPQPRQQHAAPKAAPSAPPPDTPNAPDTRPAYETTHAATTKPAQPPETANQPPVPKTATLPANAPPSVPAAPPPPAPEQSAEQPAQKQNIPAVPDFENGAQPGAARPLPTGEAPVHPLPPRQPETPVLSEKTPTAATPEQPPPEPPETRAAPMRHMRPNPYLAAARPAPPLETLQLPPMPKVATLPPGAAPSIPTAPQPPPATMASLTNGERPTGPTNPQPETTVPVEGREATAPTPLPPSAPMPPQPQPPTHNFPNIVSGDQPVAPSPQPPPQPSQPPQPVPPPSAPLPPQPQPPAHNVPNIVSGDQPIAPSPQPPPQPSPPPQPQPPPGLSVPSSEPPPPPAFAAPPALPPTAPQSGANDATPAQPEETAEPHRELSPDQGKALADAIRKEARQRFFLRLDPYLTPGGNRPEIELLKPNGFLDRFLADAAGRDARIMREAERLIKNLLSDDSETRERALRDLPAKEKAVLHEAAARLTRMEQQLLRADAQLSRLSDAAGTLRDLGRQLLAVKAENVAGQERNPQVMLAEVPFKLNDGGGGGRMQMFYRKSGGKKESWTSRVILDLNTTGLGPVLGDMRFFASNMALTIFVDKQETADFLAAAADSLTEDLQKKGFRLASRFMVLPPPPPPPKIIAERPQMREDSETAGPPSPFRHPGRLDAKA